MTWWKWSRTAASNSSADSTINWAEGQAPGTVNNSARAMMAAAAKYRDDMAGAVATAGTSSAYTLTTYQVFTSLDDGISVAFTPHATNAAGATLAVDGLTARALRTATGIAIAAGALIAGTPYVATYNLANTEWRIHGGVATEYVLPLGSLVPYAGTTAPSDKFALLYGQAISRTTYATLFTLLGTTFGVGDGSTTFNLPDLRGRVVAGQDDMGGSSANRLTGLSGGVDGDTFGAAGGDQSNLIDLSNLPNVNLSSASLTGTTTTAIDAPIGADGVTDGNWTTGAASRTLQTLKSGAGTLDSVTPTFTSATTIGGNVPLGGSASPVNNVQPTIILNYIMRVL